MKKVVCPYCDQPINGKYCDGCRRIVWKPKQMEVTYYLNERHPSGEENCQFHGDILTGDMAEAKKSEIRKRMLEKQRETNAKIKPVSVPNVPKRTTPPNKHVSVNKKKATSKLRIGLIIYGIALAVGVLLPILSSIVDRVGRSL